MNGRPQLREPMPHVQSVGHQRRRSSQALADQRTELPCGELSYLRGPFASEPPGPLGARQHRSCEFLGSVQIRPVRSQRELLGLRLDHRGMGLDQGVGCRLRIQVGDP